MKSVISWGWVVVASMLVFLSGASAFAQGVVVVPLGGAVGDATPADVVKGKTFSCAAGKGLTGTLELNAECTGEAEPSDVLAGKTFSSASGNGLTGSRRPAMPAKTGQTASLPLDPAPTGADGDADKGVDWPDPRFTDNGDGTVTDNLTGLVWLQDANCFGSETWSDALSASNTLAYGYCGLTDGSSAGDWRLPNLRELQSLIAYQYSYPALSDAAGTGIWSEGDAFSGVESGYYWSSTTYADGTGYAWVVYLSVGSVSVGSKSGSYDVWPVRD